jgi:guanosine-3',5'-bis(diphosphate) 3'-pyrophosphohydrolase
VSSLTSPIAAQHPSPDPCPEEVRALELRLAEYLPEAQVKKVRRAYEIGAAAHAGQLRKSGEAYITHPVAVAGILWAEWDRQPDAAWQRCSVTNTVAGCG